MAFSTLSKSGMNLYCSKPPLVKYIVIGVSVGVALHFCIRKMHAYSQWKKRKAYKRGVVVVHQFERGRTLPNISAYCLKLETYLRMAKIPYENEFGDPLAHAPYGKAPWITYNDQDIGDSNLCVDFLNNELNIDLNSKLSSEQKAVGVFLVAIAETQLGKCLALHRFVYDDKNTIKRMHPWPSCPPFIVVYNFIKKGVKAQIDYSRFPREAVERIGKKTLKCLSDFLGDKPFFLGDTPCEADASLFGMLSQIVWTFPGSCYQRWLNGDFVNLKNYCYRMKDRYWQDWNECLSP